MRFIIATFICCWMISPCLCLFTRLGMPHQRLTRLGSQLRDNTNNDLMTPSVAKILETENTYVFVQELRSLLLKFPDQRQQRLDRKPLLTPNDKLAILNEVDARAMEMNVPLVSELLFIIGKIINSQGSPGGFEARNQLRAPRPSNMQSKGDDEIWLVSSNLITRLLTTSLQSSSFSTYSTPSHNDLSPSSSSSSSSMPRTPPRRHNINSKSFLQLLQRLHVSGKWWNLPKQACDTIISYVVDSILIPASLMPSYLPYPSSHPTLGNNVVPPQMASQSTTKDPEAHPPSSTAASSDASINKDMMFMATDAIWCLGKVGLEYKSTRQFFKLAVIAFLEGPTSKPAVTQDSNSYPRGREGGNRMRSGKDFASSGDRIVDLQLDSDQFRDLGSRSSKLIYGLSQLGVNWQSNDLSTKAQLNLVASLAHYLPRMNELEVVNVIYSLGKMNVMWSKSLPTSFKNVLLKELERVTPEMSPTAISNTLWAMGKCGVSWRSLTPRFRNKILNQASLP